MMPSQYSKQMSSPGLQEIGHISSKELDDVNLARMGKRPVLKVDAPRGYAL
jgi:hypothetical protein